MQISISNSVKGFRNVKNNVQQIVDAFKDRVLADGGIFESEVCLKQTLLSLGRMSDEGLIVFNFQQRVFTDGGDCESQVCLIDTLTNLNNI
ncbi:hypothetical protein [Lutibacter sp.]|uniref:hypothetical protein n=1 Tax=Lutibacter sp. TaxID=1925666 RepID=UPI0034A07B08